MEMKLDLVFNQTKPNSHFVFKKIKTGGFTNPKNRNMEQTKGP